MNTITTWAVAVYLRCTQIVAGITRRHQSMRQQPAAGVEALQVAIIGAVLAVLALAVVAVIKGTAGKYISQIGGL